MKMLKKITRFAGLLCIGFMFAVCMVLGVVPIIPKRKEQFEIEIKAGDVKDKTENMTTFTLPKNKQQ